MKSDTSTKVNTYYFCYPYHKDWIIIESDCDELDTLTNYLRNKYSDFESCCLLGSEKGFRFYKIDRVSADISYRFDCPVGAYRICTGDEYLLFHSKKS